MSGDYVLMMQMNDYIDYGEAAAKWKEQRDREQREKEADYWRGKIGAQLPKQETAMEIFARVWKEQEAKRFEELREARTNIKLIYNQAALMQKPNPDAPKCCGHVMQKSALKPQQRYCTWCRTYKPA